MKITEYKVIKDKDVVKYLEEGWKLHGGGFASHQGYFMQAVLRYEDGNSTPATNTTNDDKSKKRSGFFGGR